ncbi:MAG TPA: hypothetical protein VEN47_15130 [Myxococcota bacterium]|nr:hypothetical protein [Myxococcota bacterium]
MSRWLALAGLALAACGGGTYSSDRSEHAEWSGVFPSEDADVQQTIAAISAPAHGYKRTVLQLTVWRIQGDRWAEVPDEVLRGPAPSSGDFAIAATLQCEFDDGQARFLRGAQVWYLLLDDRLAAYDHYEFVRACDLQNAFRPAPGSLAGMERTLVSRLGTCNPACASSQLESYEKGRAFARAERFDDARAMLQQGDARKDWHYEERPRLPGPHTPSAGPSANDVRAALVRDLGGEP